MQSKTSSAGRGMYYYRGRYWSTMPWFKLKGQAAGVDEPQSARGWRSVTGETEQTPHVAEEQVARPAPGR